MKERNALRILRVGEICATEPASLVSNYEIDGILNPKTVSTRVQGTHDRVFYMGFFAKGETSVRNLNH
jgi:hypothetical protein